MLQVRNAVNECNTREELVKLLYGLVENVEEVNNMIQVGIII